MDTKICSSCNCELPATDEYFGSDRRSNRLNARCRECDRADARERYRRNAERYKAYSRQYSKDHHDEIVAKNKAWRAQHPDKVRAYSRQYYWNNLGRCREWAIEYGRQHRHEKLVYNIRYYAANKEKILWKNSQWRRQHIEQVAALSRKRRAAVFGASGTHNEDDVARIYDEQNGLCYWCGVAVGEERHVDHYMPLCLGGSNDPDNLVIACPKCNLRKGSKHPDEFRRILTQITGDVSSEIHR